MSSSISGTTITLTRGDSFVANISITDSDGNPYTPTEGDTVRFAMKASLSDVKPVLIKDIPIETMKLVIEPSDTSGLNFGTYSYDIQLTKASGEVYTFITVSKLKLTEEVY